MSHCESPSRQAYRKQGYAYMYIWMLNIKSIRLPDPGPRMNTKLCLGFRVWRRLLLRPGHITGYLWQVWVVPSGGGGKINSPQTATIVVIKQSLGSRSHLWSLSNVSGCGSTSLFGSRAGTHQIRDQSHALEDRNDRNNSLEVYTPNSFIHLFYNSLNMDIVDMHNVIVTPSDSVLWEKTMEASYLVGSFPCHFNFISVYDIPVLDDFWEQATSGHFCPFR